MVTARPNLAIVELAPAGPRRFGPAPGWVSCPVDVLAVEAMPGEVDLLSPARGRQLTAMMRHEVAEVLPLEGWWRVEARLVGPRMLRVMTVLGHGRGSQRPPAAGPAR